MALSTWHPGTSLDNRLYQRQSGMPLPLASCSWISPGLMLLNGACELAIMREPSIPPPRLLKLRFPALSESADRPPRYVGVDCASWRWPSCAVASWRLWIGGTPERELKSAHAGVLSRTAASTRNGITRTVRIVTMMAPPVRLWFLSALVENTIATNRCNEK